MSRPRLCCLPARRGSFPPSFPSLPPSPLCCLFSLPHPSPRAPLLAPSSPRTLLCLASSPLLPTFDLRPSSDTAQEERMGAGRGYHYGYGATYGGFPGGGGGGGNATWGSGTGGFEAFSGQGQTTGYGRVTERTQLV
eukprot:751799-Hanusia_phi.AAC.2